MIDQHFPLLGAQTSETAPANGHIEDSLNELVRLTEDVESVVSLFGVRFESVLRSRLETSTAGIAKNPTRDPSSPLEVRLVAIAEKLRQSRDAMHSLISRCEL